MPGMDELRRRDEQGSVTAEAAIVLPIMAVFALALVWLISLGIAEVRAVDAARDAAREIARGGDVAQATAAAHRTVPKSATVQVDRHADQVTVLVVVPRPPPGWPPECRPGVRRARRRHGQRRGELMVMSTRGEAGSARFSRRWAG